MRARLGLATALAVIARSAGAQATVTGTVFDSLRTNAPMKGATVVIAELSKYAPTDARGRFQIDSLPAGHYTITFLHPALDSLDLAAEARSLDVPARGSVSAQLATPSAATIYSRLCRGPGDPSLGLLIGHVTNVDDASPIARAVVTADWVEYSLEGGKLQGAVVRVNAITNANGVFVLCGVPVDSPYQVFALADSSGAGPVPMLPDPRASRLNLAVSRRDSAALLTPAQLLDTLRRAAPLSERRGSATVTGRVTATDGRPIALAEVRLAGSKVETRADSSGRFRLTGVPAGTRALEVRAIGIAPATLVLDVPSAATIDTAVKLDRNAQALGEVTVVGDRKLTLDKSGFEARRREGLGHFLTEADIEKRPTPDLFGQWMRLPGLITLTDFKGVRQLVMRGGSGVGASNNSRMRMCSPTFYLDGAYFPLDSGNDPYKTILGFAPTSGTKGIEVYTSAGSIPPQFNRSSTTGCGSVVIWTK